MKLQFFREQFLKLQFRKLASRNNVVSKLQFSKEQSLKKLESKSTLVKFKSKKFIVVKEDNSINSSKIVSAEKLLLRTFN
jgi:adenosine deaminase